MNWLEPWSNKDDQRYLFGIIKLYVRLFYVTSFSSFSYYSNLRLISKIELEKNVHSIIFDIHASANERPLHLFRFKLRSTNKYFSPIWIFLCLYVYLSVGFCTIFRLRSFITPLHCPPSKRMNLFHKPWNRL